MASWLRAAEDLFEVVDRRAKLVVSEISDEQSVGQSPASGNHVSQTKGTKSRKKAQKRLSSKKDTPNTDDTTKEEGATKMLQSDDSSQKDESSSMAENRVIMSDKTVNQTNEEQQDNFQKEFLMEMAAHTLETHVADNAGVQSDVTNAGGMSNGDVDDKLPVVREERPPSPVTAAGDEGVSEDHSSDAALNSQPGDLVVPLKKDVEISDSSISTSNNDESEVKVIDTKAETRVDEGKLQDQKAEKVQEQLNEAQGLLKTAVSTGQSKEARLARVCAGLSTRLQEYKSENAQLEELLAAERELSKSFEAQIKQLQQELSASKGEVTRIESSMAQALAAKNSEIETLINSIDSLKKQAALSEGNMASLQANMESIMRNRELTETRMIQALREELASAERRAEEERAAHHATKMAAMEREVELEHRAVEASTALARIQRISDERTAKATELEQKVALLEVECASLNQELQDMESRARRLEKKAPEDANQLNQMQAWREEVERAREAKRDAESKLSSLEAEMQKMRVEMAAMKRDADHYSRQEHMELEKRYRELTDLLYYKQTQLETMASEKAAAEFQLEKELKRLQEAQVEAERSRVSRRASATWEEDTEMKALEPLPLHHRHMAGATIQLQKAAKLLDSGAVRATRFLWRYPTARLSLLFYLVFVHLFLMYLLHRLQEKADSNAARELADAMGLQTQNLP